MYPTTLTFAPWARAQARCASRQLPFPIAEMDAVALFLFASVGEHFRGEDSAELFIRLLMGSRSVCLCVLVCACVCLCV